MSDTSDTYNNDDEELEYFDDDESFADDDWEDYEDEDEIEEQAGAVKEKKGLSFNTLVIIGALIVGGLVLVFQVSSKSSQVQVVERFRSMLTMTGATDGPVLGNQQDNQEQSKQASSELASNEPEEPQGFLNNPDILNDQDSPNIESQRPTVIEDAPPMPAPITTAQDSVLSEQSVAENNNILMPLPDIDSEQKEIEEEQVPRAPVMPPQPDIVSNADPALPKAEDILKNAIAKREKMRADSEEEQKNIETEIVTVEPIAPTPEVVDEPEIKVNIGEVALEDVPPAQPQPVSIENSRQEIQAQDAPKNDVISEAVEAKIDMLLLRLEEVEQRVAGIQISGTNRLDGLEGDIESLTSDIRELKKRPQPVVQDSAKKSVVTSTPKKIEKKTSVKPKPVKKQATVKKSIPVQWELRAAQPGKAWVSKKGQREMQAVKVGNTLSGIGQITAISYINGRWIVQGTQGQIKQ